MEQITENKSMRLAAVFTLTVLAIFLAAKAIDSFINIGSAKKGLPAVSTITVQGTGEVIVKPDIATVNFTIQNEAAVVADAQRQVTDIENKILNFLSGQGVSKDDVKTVSYNIYPRYEYRNATTYPYSEGKRILAGYTVSESITVKIRKLEIAGKILSGLGELGVTDVSGLNFDNDKRNELEKEARAKAVALAKTDAKNLAKSLGVKLVRIVSFSESGNYPIPIMYGAKAEYGMGGGGIATPEIPSGENKIVSNVSITYEIR